MFFVQILLILLELSRPGSGLSKGERACVQKGFICVASCSSRISAAAKEQCVDSCENSINNCLD